MARLARFCAVLLIFLLMLQVPAVHADDLQDNLVPKDQQSNEGQVPLQYNKYNISQYDLDIYVPKTGAFDVSGKVSNSFYTGMSSMLGGVWFLMAQVANFVGYLVQQAFTLDFISSFIPQVSASVQQIAGFDAGGFHTDGIYPMLIMLMIVLVGTWAAYVGMVKKEMTRAWSGMISAILIFVGSLLFFSQSDKILGQLNGWSRDLQTGVLNTSVNIVTPGQHYTQNEGVATIRNQMFDLMIYRPYLLLQYGSMDENTIGKSRIETLLNYDPGSDDRQTEAEKEVKDKKNKMMSIDGIKSRFMFIPILMVAGLAIGGMMMLLACSILLYQLLFLVLILFAPVPLLIALVPRWQSAAINWGAKVIHALLMKVGIAFLTTIIFSISTILYKSAQNSTSGYLFMIMTQIICYVGIWLKRKELFHFVATTTGHVVSTTRSLESFREYRAMKARMQDGSGASSVIGRGMKAKRFSDARRRHAELLNRRSEGNEYLSGNNRDSQTTTRGPGQAGSASVRPSGLPLAIRKRLGTPALPEVAATSETAGAVAGAAAGAAAGATSAGAASTGKVTSLRRPRFPSASSGGGGVSAPTAQRSSTREDQTVTDQHRTGVKQTRNREQLTDVNEKYGLVERTRLRGQTDHTAVRDQEERRNTNQQTNERRMNELVDRRSTVNESQERTMADVTNRRTAANLLTERNVSDTLNRRNVTNQAGEQTQTDVTNRRTTAHQVNERNVSETVNRRSVTNEASEQTQTDVTNRRTAMNQVRERNVSDTVNRRDIINEQRVSDAVTERNVTEDKPRRGLRDLFRRGGDR